IRLALAYAIALAWTIPLAAWIGRNPRGSRYVTPVLEVAASLPATALLPIIVGFALFATASLGPAAELSAVLIALFSMQWYLLFNLIAGVRGIPDDLNEAARSFGLRGKAYWRRVLLPAMVPSLLTGSITAWGAGWNALIVSEYIPFLSPPPHVSGLGYLLDLATFSKPPDNEMILLTILMMIVGLEPPTSGQVLFEGSPIRADNPQVAMVFQSFALFPWLTVAQNVELGLEAQGMPPEDRHARARKFIDAVGLTGFENAFPRELSGGMKQRVGLARALAIEPLLLGMDEPFSALDPLTAQNLRDEILQLWANPGLQPKAVLMAPHAIEEAVYLADRVIVLSSRPGRMVAELEIDLPRPRNRKEPEFYGWVDEIYSLIV